jgi:hypothetical protein
MVNALIKVNLTRAVCIHLSHRTIDVLVGHLLVTCNHIRTQAQFVSKSCALVRSEALAYKSVSQEMDVDGTAGCWYSTPLRTSTH